MSDVKKLRAYLAAPLLNDAERDFNVKIAALLAPFVDVFLPQRDGLLLKDLVADGQSIHDARTTVYRRDVKAIENADILVAVLDGRTVDEGVSFELGYARALNKSCIGLKTDDRSLLPNGDNPMIVIGCHHICTSEMELIETVMNHANKQSVA